jgi:predicted exporter
MTKRGAVPVVLWLLALGIAAAVAVRTRYIADMSAFLPKNPTVKQQLLVDQLRDGPASRLILLAIAGGDPGLRRDLSMATAARLRRDPQFTAVGNGEQAALLRDRDFLFQHRYLLSETVTAQRFSGAGLQSAIRDNIDNLASPAGLLMKSLLPRDPTGEMLQVIDQLDRSQGPRTQDGVWVSPRGERALLVVQTRAAGSDLDAEEEALAAIRQAFEAAANGARSVVNGENSATQGGVGAATLRMTGPAVFAVAARATIKHEAVRLSMLSSLLIVALLFAVYRSLAALLLGLLPVVSGALAGVAAVSLVFGSVHGITLGFGITLIGESVDYSIYLFIQSQLPALGGSGPEQWRRLLWPTIRLGVLTSICGFASLLPSGFPGLAQLGLYSIAGLIAAALVTRFVLPVLLPRGFAIRDVARWGKAIALPLNALRRIRSVAVVVLLAGAAALYLHPGDWWNRDLAALSPVSQTDQNFDGELRSELGTADVSDLVIVRGPDLESVLQTAERAATALEPLVDGKIIAGFDSPSQFLPSLATQAARRGALPDTPLLREHLKTTTAALGLRGDLLDPFVQDVETARAARLITPADLEGTSLAPGFEGLILHQRQGWNALLPLHAVNLPAAAARAASATGVAPARPAADIDRAAVQRALDKANLGDVLLLNLKSETDALYAGYLKQAISLSLAGFAAIVVLLGFALRSPLRVARVLAPLVLAVLAVTAMLVAGGRHLTILHLVGMLLIVAVGSNYALFFDRRGGGDEAAVVPLTLASLAIANAATVIGFGVLAFARVPVLAALGETVAPGAFLALIFAGMLSGKPVSDLRESMRSAEYGGS